MAQLLYNLIEPNAAFLGFSESAAGAARRSELDRFLFVMPTHRMQRQLERALTREHHAATGRPVGRLHVHSMESLTRRLFVGTGGTGRDISNELQAVLIRMAMENVELAFFANRDRPPSPGVVERIARIIGGMRADGNPPARILEDIRYAETHPGTPGYDIGKLRDLHAIYVEYLRLLDAHWIDAPGRMLQVNSALLDDHDKVFRRAFPAATHLLLCGYSEFTRPELSLLEGLGHVANLHVSIYFDYAIENGPLYGNFDEAIAKLENAGYTPHDLDPLASGIPEEGRHPFDHHMRRNLFRTDERIPNPSFDDQLGVIGFYNRDEEAEGIAALVKWLVTEKGIPAESICVAAHDPLPYAPLFRMHLGDYGIPSAITAPIALAESPLITALFAVLSIPTGGYARRDVIRAVSSPYLSFGADVDAAALTAAAAQLRITRGRESWRRRLAQKMALIERYLQRAEEEEQADQKRELELLQRATLGFEALVERIQGFDHPMSASEFREAVLQLMATLHVAENVLQLRRRLDVEPRPPLEWQRIHDGVEQDSRALARFTEILDELAEFFEVQPELSRGNAEEERRPLELYIEHLRSAVARAHFEVREKHDFGVLVTSFSQLRGLDFDTVILCGMIDGEFPGRYVPEVFLGRPVAGAEERRIRRERIEFYQAVTAFRRGLYLTYPHFSGERALVRSSFVDAFLRITTIEEHGGVLALDELRAERERLRHDGAIDERKRFLTLIGSPATLAEEAGAAIWSGEPVPTIPGAEGMLEHLRFTAAIERGRHEANMEGNAAAVPEYRGIIGGVLTQNELGELSERREREYSVSQLELYGRCPFKYFARRVLRAEAPATFDLSLTPLERGTLLHRVLFRLYVELRDRELLPITPAHRAPVLDRARELAREEIAGIVFDHPYWRIDQERLLGSDQIDGLLEQWIDYEAFTNAEKSRLGPAYFETSFGTSTVRGSSSDPLLTADHGMRLHGINVRGKVDRIELLYEGEDLYFAVADYKTGHAPSRNDVLQGLSLQLMIYLEAVRQILADRFGLPLLQVKPVGGIYYQLKPRESDVRVTYLFVPNELRRNIVTMNRSSAGPESIADLEQVIEGAFAFARDYVEGIAAGDFPVTRHDVNVICRGCDFRSACRVSEVGSVRPA